MDSKQFLFYDHAQNYYSSVTQERFYQVVAKKEQLSKLLLTPQSLRFLQEESKHYHHTILAALGGSILLLYPINKYAPFGSGFSSYAGKLFLSVGLVGGALYYASQTCRDRLSDLKKKIYMQNRANFRKYELTGDITQVDPRITLIDA